jgi:curved DNA-binding protein CbpA
VSEKSGDHYDALGLSRQATREQVEVAYQFFAALYAESALATYSLLEPDERREARERVRLAYEVLRDSEQRRQYDAGLGAAHAGPVLEAPRQTGPRPVFKMAASKPAPAPAPAQRPLPSPPRPEASARARILPEPVTGPSLRKAREERGVSLQEIAAATKIGVRFLDYIESDRYAALPALVYVRGFVQQYARFLGLDPQRTSESYLLRFPRG